MSKDSQRSQLHEKEHKKAQAVSLGFTLLQFVPPALTVFWVVFLKVLPVATVATFLGTNSIEKTQTPSSPNLDEFSVKLLWVMLLTVFPMTLILREIRSKCSHLDKIETIVRDLETCRNSLRLSFPEDLAGHFSSISEHFSQAQEKFGHISREGEIMKEHMQKLVTDFASCCDQLPQGHMKTDYDDCSLLSKHVAELKDGESLIGLTHWEADKQWWESTDAQVFLDANAYAIDTGKATINRIFVYEKDEELPSLGEEMLKQRLLGVTVDSISRDALPDRCPRLASQCVLKRKNGSGNLEGWLTYKVELDGKGKPRWNIFSIDSYEIGQHDKALELILDRIRRLKSQHPQAELA